MPVVVPEVVGVPEINPPELIDKPAGRDPDVIAQDEYVPDPPEARI